MRFPYTAVVTIMISDLIKKHILFVLAAADDDTVAVLRSDHPAPCRR